METHESPVVEVDEADLADERLERRRTAEALGAFFAGLLLVTVVPFGFAALLAVFFNQEVVQRLFPLVAVIFVVPAVLLARKASRRFGGYLLLGMLLTAAVILGVGSAVLWFMVTTNA